MTTPPISTNAGRVRYHVREMQQHEAKLMIRYFLTADLAFLNGMGVDPKKLPSELEWAELLKADFARPIQQRQFYYLVWEADGVAIGHCNINKIVFGEAAYMHLHIWDAGQRRKGCATQLLRPSITRFFEAFQLDKLFCEPYALNPGPNQTLPKLGFHLVRTYETTPGWIAFHQPVNLWVLEREAALSAPNQANQSSHDINLALRLERQLWKAVAAKDGAALHRFLADDYMEITLEGRRVEKTQLVGSSPQVDHIVRYEIESERLVWLGRDTLLLSYHLILDGTCRDVAIEPPDRWATSIWSRRDAGWQCSFFQQSPFHPEFRSPAPTPEKE